MRTLATALLAAGLFTGAFAAPACAQLLTIADARIVMDGTGVPSGDDVDCGAVFSVGDPVVLVCDCWQQSVSVMWHPANGSPAVSLHQDANGNYRVPMDHGGEIVVMWSVWCCHEPAEHWADEWTSTYPIVCLSSSAKTQQATRSARRGITASMGGKPDA